MLPFCSCKFMLFQIMIVLHARTVSCYGMRLKLLVSVIAIIRRYPKNVNLESVSHCQALFFSA